MLRVETTVKAVNYVGGTNSQEGKIRSFSRKSNGGSFWNDRGKIFTDYLAKVKQSTKLIERVSTTLYCWMN